MREFKKTTDAIEAEMRRRRLWRDRTGLTRVLEVYGRVRDLLSRAGDSVGGTWAPHLADLGQLILTWESRGESAEREREREAAKESQSLAAFARANQGHA